MELQSTFLLGLLLVLGCAVTSSVATNSKHSVATCSAALLNRSSFPEGFLFGAAGSAYQYEGAANEGGRGPSIWDTFTHKYPERIKDRSNGDVAIDQYHRYKEDVQILKDTGFDAYRFSISWSRLLPNGKLSGGVNKEGIKYYKNLLNKLAASGIKPAVTLFHWDVPQTLEDEYGGFLSLKIVNHFRDYAELCFKEFGDKIKYWITFNEPWTFSKNAYARGLLAPARCSNWQKLNCTGGDSATEPYLVTHHQLLAHAKVVKLYKDKYQASQKGLIGITLVSLWFEPLSDTQQDKDAASRAVDFMLGWFMDPLAKGEYPKIMQSLAGNRLPKFTKVQSKSVKGSFDFIGLNYYTTYYAADAPPLPNATIYPSYLTDARTQFLTERNGTSIGPKAGSSWLFIYPKGLQELLLHVKKNYHNPLIYITENGVSELTNPKLSREEALVDYHRIDYYDSHLYYLHAAIKDGVNVKGYFAWSFLDNFEWNDGYTVRFGIYYVDYKDELKRYPKLSANWFKNFLQKKKCTPGGSKPKGSEKPKVSIH
ncbi:Hypothetical predicted protein [Prunus dulcis]|uniref:Uncharacterized protein n=1 Tax=Prunus dulcis TaxID=3755 RepID=A0A5E4FW67_PRUDU|nr:beta-glucosidase 24-like [Prunus dulcis]KAI5321210.1 hypothetical protein L3X38_030281 [Prunus dulcis]VVA31713.1 Hypothetical predicted protein [Prunus dulcis]